MTLTVNAAAPPAPNPPQAATPLASPQTGDGSHIGLWLALLAVGALGMAGLLLWRKRRQAA